MYLNIITGCETKKTLKIALSKGTGSEHYQNYSRWLKSNNNHVECVDLYSLSLDKALMELGTCCGLVLTGGPDVHPFKYGKGEDAERCEIDLRRDTLEFQLIKKAGELKIPILGICRGQQILNVAYGGSLVVDIPTDYSTQVSHRMENADSCFHNIKVEKNSSLYKICNVQSGLVNSNHHQAVSQIAAIFKPIAKADDGIIESIEWRDSAGKPFLLAVQWHPERMNNDKLFSMPIAKLFLEKAKIYKDEKN